MRLLPVLTALLLAALPGLSQELAPPTSAAGAAGDVVVGGRVFDAYTARPIAGAAVEANGRRVKTDEEGRFELRLPPGRWTIEVEAEGYGPDSAVVRTTSGTTPSPFDFALLDRGRFTDEVEVTAEGSLVREQGPSELPVRPTEVQMVAGAVDNVFRTLHTLPGISVTTEFDSRMSVRGGGPDQNLTVMDGIEVHNPYRLFGLTSAFNPETVSDFELSSGAFSARYGDRLSSLLVVANRPGVAGQGLGGSATLSLTDANVLLEGELPGPGSGTWLVTARRTYYDLVANGIVGEDLPSFGDIQARTDWDLGGARRLTLFGLLSREATDATFEGDRENEEGSVFTDARNDLMAVTFSTPLGRSGTSRTVLSYYINEDVVDFDALFRSDQRRSNAPDDDLAFRQTNVVFDIESRVGDLALRQDLGFSLGGHFLETGAELHRLDTVQRWSIPGDRNPNAANGSSIQGGAGLPDELDSSVASTRLGAWVQDRFRLASRVTLEGGLRFDWSSANRRGTLSPRLGATVRLDDATRLRAGGGLFTQSPGYEKLVQADYFVDLSADGPLDLRHERAWHAVAGLERDLAPGLVARVEGYWKRYEDLIVGRLETEEERLGRVGRYDFPPQLQASIPVAATITSVPVNDARGESWGLEVFLQKRPGPGTRLSGWASYTWGQARRDQYGLRQPFDYDRRHAVSLVGSWRINGRFHLAATFRAFSGFPRTPIVGLRVAADETGDGRLVPALDAEGRYVYETSLGDVSNLNSSRLPTYARLDLRLSWLPGGADGRWLVYLDVINATNRKNAATIEPRLDYDPSGSQPRLVEERSGRIPLLPSIGVRFRF
jgi:outer membrane receptor protein involved in Fe transport